MTNNISSIIARSIGIFFATPILSLTFWAFIISILELLDIRFISEIQIMGFSIIVASVISWYVGGKKYKIAWLGGVSLIILWVLMMSQINIH